MSQGPAEDFINFGKYKDLSLSALLRDRKYCSWLLQQDWFSKQYEYLYNRIKNHKPKDFFITKPPYIVKPGPSIDYVMDFMENYPYFSLCPVTELKVPLSENEKKCYEFYLETIESLKDKIINNVGSTSNPFDIKAPTSWLNKFEKRYELSRDIFKEFLSAYDLPNLPYIVEDIKKMGGLEYKGARSFLIAKENSLQQEKFWENILKTLYGEDINPQYVWKRCIFDFIRIKTNTLYECKLGLKDFDEAQHTKYSLTLGTYSLIYLIGRDCIVDIDRKTLFTTSPDKYTAYLQGIPLMKDPSKFDKIISGFAITSVKNVEDGLV